jgi:transcription termination factor Rho
VQPVKGYLEILDKGFGFLRSIENNFAQSSGDTFTPAYLIKKYALSEGSLIEGDGSESKRGAKNLKLEKIERVNGVAMDNYATIKPIHEKTSINPSRNFILAKNGKDITGRALDVITPIGMGQRGLIISPPKSGKTTLLKHMASSILSNHPNVVVFILLVDERPEEVTEFRRELEGANVLFSSADNSVSQHMRITRLAMNAALREVETGKDVVVFLDSLTRLSRSFNAETQSYGRTLSGGLGAKALEIPRQIFGAARNIEEGGSLTIIATILINTGSRMDDVIFEEFKGTGNMDLVLSPKCAEQRIWPAINIKESGTRKEELLLSEEQLMDSSRIRRETATLHEVAAMERLIAHLRDTAS